MNAFGNTAESVVKATLTGATLNQFLMDMAKGQSAQDALGDLLPMLSLKTSGALHPDVASQPLELQGTAGHNATVQAEVISAARDLALAHQAAQA